jgi:hypothetical protein
MGEGKPSSGDRCTVTSPYRSAYPDPLRLRGGDQVVVEDRQSEWPGWLWCETSDGKAGWIPEAYVERKGNIGRLLTDYDATELTVAEGEDLVILKEAGGWLWCQRQNGDRGWIPKANVEAT